MILVPYAWLLGLVVECTKVIECQDMIILSQYHESQYSSKLYSKKSLAKVDQIVRERVIHGTLIMSMTYWDPYWSDTLTVLNIRNSDYSRMRDYSHMTSAGRKVYWFGLPTQSGGHGVVAWYDP